MGQIIFCYASMGYRPWFTFQEPSYGIPVPTVQDPTPVRCGVLPLVERNRRVG